MITPSLYLPSVNTWLHTTTSLLGHAQSCPVTLCAWLPSSTNQLIMQPACVQCIGPTNRSSRALRSSILPTPKPSTFTPPRMIGIDGVVTRIFYFYFFSGNV
jgi:hypothetical protein